MSEMPRYASAVQANNASMKIKELEAEIIRLRAVLAALAEKDADAVDAKRYRWLRDNWYTMKSSYTRDCVQFNLGVDRWSELPISAIDNEIDRHIKAAIALQSAGDNGDKTA